jgi:hypothetical protein
MVYQVAHGSMQKHHRVHHIQQHAMKINLAVLFTIPPPPLLDEILLNIIVHICISDVMIHLNKVLHSISTLMRPHLLTYQAIATIHLILATLILSDHIRHEHTTIDYVPKDLLVSKPRWTFHNRKLDPKCSLQIFLRSHSSIVDLEFFLTVRGA